jgi:EH domain-containing protein 1
MSPPPTDHASGAAAGRAFVSFPHADAFGAAKGHHPATNTNNTSSPSKNGVRAPANTSAAVNAKRAIYDSWFRAADADGDGRVTGADAVAFFARSGLERPTLARVWELANSNRAGYLDKPSFFRAMDLISLAQASGGLVPRDAASALGGLGNAGGGNGQRTSDDMVSADCGTYDSYVSGGLGPMLAAPRMAGLCTDPDAADDAPAAAAEEDGGSARAGTTTPTDNKNKSSGGGGGGNAFARSLLSSLTSSSSSSRRARKAPIPPRVCTSVVDGLKAVYFGKVRALEEAFRLDAFFQPLLQEADFDAKPSVLLLGQYSTGKTTFVRHLLGRAYPGAHVGPEPTTDRFVVVRGGLEERRTPGHTLAVQPDQPYQALNHFGAAFLSRFEGSTCPAPLLDSVTLVDTPGVLSGEKQRVERQYNFVGAVEWFAARADMVLLLFDPFKLDVSDELKSCIHALRGHEEKVRVVLNKADLVDAQELMRVYGALMWSLSKVFRSPEVCKVYIGELRSFGFVVFRARAEARSEIGANAKTPRSTKKNPPSPKPQPPPKKLRLLQRRQARQRGAQPHGQAAVRGRARRAPRRLVRYPRARLRPPRQRVRQARARLEGAHAAHRRLAQALAGCLWKGAGAEAPARRAAGGLSRGAGRAPAADGRLSRPGALPRGAGQPRPFQVPRAHACDAKAGGERAERGHPGAGAGVREPFLVEEEAFRGLGGGRGGARSRPADDGARETTR